MQNLKKYIPKVIMAAVITIFILVLMVIFTTTYNVQCSNGLKLEGLNYAEVTEAGVLKAGEASYKLNSGEACRVTKVVKQW